MKYIFTLIAALTSLIVLNGQGQVILKINHLLDGAPFELNKQVKNNLEDPFTVSRLEYYISNITLMHSTGETLYPDMYVLANGAESLEIDFGQVDAMDLKGVKIHVGVHPDVNHLDPTVYPADHPLALKEPSMHWGWAGGYRFVALEGQGGTASDFKYELHALGDVNYKEFEIPMDIKLDESTTVIVDGHYERLLKDIKVERGLFSHGEKFEAKTLIVNFINSVFELAATPTNTIDTKWADVSIFPNPSIGGQSTISLGTLAAVDIKVVNNLGQTVYKVTEQSGKVQLPTLHAGSYWIQLSSDGNNYHRMLIVR